MTGLRTVGGAVGVPGAIALQVLNADANWRLLTAVLPRTNLVTNPSAAAGNTGWFTTTGVTPLASGGNVRPTCWQIVGSAANNVTNYIYTNPAVPLTPGQTVTISCAAKRVVGASNLRFIAESSPAHVIPAAGTDATVTLTGSYARYSTTFVVPTGVTTLNAFFVISCVTVNDSIYVGDVLIEVANGPGTYFDGSTPADADYTYSWSGAVNGSQSVASP